MYKNYTIKHGIRIPYASKILLIMRLTTVILIASFLQVSASTFAQKVTLKKNVMSMKQVFEELEKQTGYTVIYFHDNFNDKKTVEVNFSQASLDQVMTKVLSGLPFNFVIKGQAIVLTEKPKTIIDHILNMITNIDAHGHVVDENGKGLAGAVIKLKEGKRSTLTDETGEFILKSIDENSVIVISFLGYKTREIKANDNLNNIKLEPVSSELDEVGVMSTGYQTIPKERATGSFTNIDNKLINRSVSTNILDRLDGVTSGLIFTKSTGLGALQSSIEIRGRSTLFSNAQPLVVLDNFPYDGDLGNINPNDIENITVLKDAAAASVWGTRSGNGVIVITTKKGVLNSAPKISFNANVNIGQKPELFYTPQLTSAQYIDVEQFLFNKGAYNTLIDDGYSALSPAVEIFNAKVKGNISVTDSINRINKLKGIDVRNQLLKYYYRPSVNQQYQVGISGGGANQKYIISAGYDKNLNNRLNGSDDRITLNAKNTYYLIQNKLELNTGIIYTNSKNQSSSFSGVDIYPYDQFADETGNSLIVANTLRPSYAATAGDGKLLNWLYKPLDELRNNYNRTVTNLTDIRLDFSANYKIIDGLNAAAYYNYEKGISDSRKFNELESFYTRNRINSFTQIDATTGAVTYPLPVGGILLTNSNAIKSQNGRFQLNYDKKWGENSLSALAGTEIRDYSNLANNNTFVGYDPETAVNQNGAVNTTVTFPTFPSGIPDQIFSNPTELGTNNRYFSYYFNGSYTYSDKYIASLSARRDESNIFGVSANQKGVPLWSAGLAWVLNQEKFYAIDWMPKMKLRATFGYTGNVNNSLYAYLTALTGFANLYNTSSSFIQNPPNPSLKWERNQNLNVGLEFASKAGRISGSIDIWRKKGLDLIGNSPIAPQTGITLYTGNSANTRTKGIDFQLNTVNLTGDLKWYTTLLYNFTDSKVTSYKVSNGSNYNVVSGNYNNPLEGYPYYALFSFKYAGLNNFGNPQAYLNGVISTDYNAIRNSTDRQNLVYNGSAIPTSFGSIYNTLNYKNFDLSFNVIFKFNYYFRRNSLNNSILFRPNGNNYQMSDYDNRWQVSGDELKTNVPALIYPGNTSRDDIYQFSDALIERADHIRLRDVRIGYTFLKRSHFPFQNLNVFTYVNNLGILWRANDQNIDPDALSGLPNPRTIAFGIHVNL